MAPPCRRALRGYVMIGGSHKGDFRIQIVAIEDASGEYDEGETVFEARVQSFTWDEQGMITYVEDPDEDDQDGT